MVGFGVTLDGGAGRGLVLRVLNSRSIGRLPAFGARPPFSRLGFSFPIAQPARQRAPAQLRDWEVQFPLPQAGSEQAGPQAPGTSLGRREAGRWPGASGARWACSAAVGANCRARELISCSRERFLSDKGVEGEPCAAVCV